MKKAELTTDWGTLPGRLRYLMKSLNLKQKDFAGACGVSENYISLLVTGRRQGISEPLCRLICQMYGVREEWLKEGAGEPFAMGEAETAEQLRGRLSEVMEGLNSAQLKQMLSEAMRQMEH